MTIQRPRLAFEDHYVQVPNEWMRDARLSLKARGLLAQMMTHRPGWTVSVARLVETNPEGRAAIMGAVQELEAHGYLVRDQRHDQAGQFGAVEYTITDPRRSEPLSDYPTSGGPLSDYPTSDNPHPKKTISSEDHMEEDHPQETPPASRGTATSGARDDLEAAFVEFYERTFPRRVGRAAARAAFMRAVKGGKDRAPVPAAVILAGARRYAADPNLPETRFVPHPATWLNQGRWEDDPEPARSSGYIADEVALARRFAAMEGPHA